MGLAILVAGGAWFWLQSRDGGGAAARGGAAPDTAAVRAGTAGPREDLPELEASDELVRRLAAGLSSHPRLAEWLATDSLIHRFVGAVVRVAAGRSPREPLGFMEPEGEFRVRQRDGPAVIDSASFRRYDPMAATVASLDTRGTAELYRRLQPLFQEAYREMGFRDGSFDAVFARALEILLAVPVPERPIEVEPVGGTAWEYRNPELEGLNPAQKHLLRMGPDNVRRVQAKLRDLAQALDLPEPARPGSPGG